MHDSANPPQLSDYFFRQAEKAGKLSGDDDGHRDALVSLFFEKYYENVARECDDAR